MLPEKLQGGVGVVLMVVRVMKMMIRPVRVGI